jgi:hypothetical protein
MNFKTIQLGDKNDLVGDWQSFLRGENIYLGAIDDDFGNATETATKELTELLKDKSPYHQKLALSSYLEDSTHPNHIKREYDPILQFKE